MAVKTLIEGVRDQPEEYRVDGRPVVALARWPAAVRRRLRLLAPGYHLPASPVPALMGTLLHPYLRSAVAGASATASATVRPAGSDSGSDGAARSRISNAKAPSSACKAPCISWRTASAQTPT